MRLKINFEALEPLNGSYKRYLELLRDILEAKSGVTVSQEVTCQSDGTWTVLNDICRTRKGFYLARNGFFQVFNLQSAIGLPRGT